MSANIIILFLLIFCHHYLIQHRFCIQSTVFLLIIICSKYLAKSVRTDLELTGFIFFYLHLLFKYSRAFVTAEIRILRFTSTVFSNFVSAVCARAYTQCTKFNQQLPRDAQWVMLMLVVIEKARVVLIRHNSAKKMESLFFIYRLS